MTLLIMSLSLIFIIPSALIVERFDAWKELINSNFECNIVILLIGIVITSLFQWNCVAITNYVEPVLVGSVSLTSSVVIYLASVAASGVTLTICNCTQFNGNIDYNTDNRQMKSIRHHCDSSKNSLPTDCPCFDNVTNEFVGKFANIHIIGVSMILIGMLLYAYVKYKGNHVSVKCCDTTWYVYK